MHTPTEEYIITPKFKLRRRNGPPDFGNEFPEHLNLKPTFSIAKQKIVYLSNKIV